MKKAVWKQPDGAGGFEKVYHETSADMVKYSDTTVANVLEELPLADMSEFMKNVLLADGAEAVRKILAVNKDPFYDECGNYWVVDGAPYISETNAKFGGKALQLNGSSAIGFYDVYLGGKDFAVAGWAYVAGTGRQNLFSAGDRNDNFILEIDEQLKLWLWVDGGGSNIINLATESCPLNQLFHFELDYINETQTLLLFIDGKKIYEAQDPNFATQRYFYLFALGEDSVAPQYKLTGTLDECILLNGKTLHTASFTPPTAPYIKDEFTYALLHFDS